MYPEHDFIAVPEELHEHEGLLQLHALLGEAREQQLPQTVQLVQATPDGLRREMPGRDHLTAGVVQDHDGVGVCRHFSFESLVLLDLSLKEKRFVLFKRITYKELILCQF